MARSKLDTLIYATILLAPMVTAVGYVAWTPAPDAVVVVVEAPALAPAPLAPVLEVSPPAPASEPAPVPVPEASPTPPTIDPEPSVRTPEAPRDPDPLPAIPGAGMLMFEGQVVLVTHPDTRWSKGRLRAPNVEESVIASKLVDTTKLPAELAPLVGSRVVVYASDGSACTATTGAMTIYAREDGEITHDEYGEPLDVAGLLDLRKQVFASAQLLLARQSRISDEGGARRCEGVWARRADLPAPAVFGRRELDSDVEDLLKAQVLAAIVDLPEVVSLRAAFEADRAGHDEDVRAELPDWTRYRDEHLLVTRWDEVGGGRSFVNVELGDAGEGCSDMFAEQRFLLFALQGGLLVQQPGAGFKRPVALMDLERDGSLEAVTAGRERLGGAADEAVVQRYEIPYHGCQC